MPQTSVAEAKFSTVSTQTDTEPSTEQLFLYFINCLSIFISGKTMLFKLKIQDLAQSMLRLHIPTDKLISKQCWKIPFEIYRNIPL